jgi:hypothetical protein
MPDRLEMGTLIKDHALLIVMTTIFAVLALDIAVPAVVLSLMAISRWVVSLEFVPADLKGEAA